MKSDVVNCIPSGCMLSGMSDDALAAMRKSLQEKLLKGQPISVGNNGNVSNPEEPTAVIPEGKLAVQWYERNPKLLDLEKAAMKKCGFGSFELIHLDDGRLAWTGYISPGLMDGESRWHVMAVYNNNHPQQVMGSSVRVYMVHPTIEDVIEALGWTPSHLLTDSRGDRYLCTARAEDVKVGETTTSAASVLLWATRWISTLELVCCGEISKEDFNAHGKI